MLTVSHYRQAMLKRLIPTAILVKMDALAQQTGNWWQLTPSVFVRARAVGESPTPSPGAFFACPECKTALFPSAGQAIRCPGCQRIWRIQDEIYDFRQPA
jgi:hypothetical protein